MKTLKIITLVLVVLFVGMQFIPTSRNQSNTVSKTDFMTLYEVPEKLKNKIQVSCYDCHSNNTNYPWYNKIQPVAWVLEGHIKEGKEELNLNEFGSYSVRRQKSKLKSIMSQIEDDKMPLSSYTLIHRDAKFSKSEKTHIIDWLSNLRDSLQQHN